MTKQTPFEQAIIHEVKSYCEAKGIKPHSLAVKIGYTNTEKFREFFDEGTGSMTTYIIGKLMAYIRKDNGQPTVYISGPITGLDTRTAEKAFQAAEHFLKSQNLNVVNPMKLQHEHGGTWEDFMKEDLEALLKCDQIYMLKGWKESRGAKVEHRIAKDLGYKVMVQE